MTRKIALLAVLIGITAITAVVSNAQTIRQVRTSVPFDFSVSGVNLPAGDYVISIGGNSISGSSVVIRSAEGSGAVLAMVRIESVSNPNDVLGIKFQRVDGNYYLEGITLYATKLNFETPEPNNARLALARK